jgi:hypothetical protein
MQDFIIYGHIIALIILNVNIFLCSVYVSSAHTGHFTKRAGAASQSMYIHTGVDENKGGVYLPSQLDIRTKYIFDFL